MYSYFKIFGIITFAYVLYCVNYILLREAGSYLYLGRFFTYELDVGNIILAYFASVPVISYIIKNSTKRIFLMLLSTLLLVGVLPGVIVYSLSNSESIYLYFILYIYVVFVFVFFARNKVAFSLGRVGEFGLSSGSQRTDGVNLLLLRFFGLVATASFIYLIIKYFNIISFRGIAEVYVQRSLFQSVVLGWEAYFILFSKSVGAFSLLIIAVGLRRPYYLLPLIFIYLSDYSLAAHKDSIVSMIFAIFYYFVLSKIDLKKHYFVLVVCGIALFSLVLQYALVFENSWLDIVVSLYDRVFHVTSGLFGRFYEYTNENYFFFGGTGLLGKVFSGVDNGMASTYEIGQAYFSEGVRANADLVADGYLNFGIAGSFCQLFFLWLLFNKRDDRVFHDHFILIFPMVFVYSKILFSMGLQTTLFSSGLFFFIIMIKFGFRPKGIVT